jgi:hypothetical protein
MQRSGEGEESSVGSLVAVCGQYLATPHAELEARLLIELPETAWVRQKAASPCIETIDSFYADSVRVTHGPHIPEPLVIRKRKVARVEMPSIVINLKTEQTVLSAPQTYQTGPDRRKRRWRRMVTHGDGVELAVEFTIVNGVTREVEVEVVTVADGTHAVALAVALLSTVRSVVTDECGFARPVSVPGY